MYSILFLIHFFFEILFDEKVVERKDVIEARRLISVATQTAVTDEFGILLTIISAFSLS